MAKRKGKKQSVLESQPDTGAPLDSRRFLNAAQTVLKRLDQDLLVRAKASPSVTLALRERHRREKEAERTADGYDVWLRQFVGQVGAAWLLSTVFVRTLEDRGLLHRNRIAGPGALDSQRLFFELAPSLTERDYLLTVFRELSHFPAARALFDTRQNPVWLLAPSAEAAKKLLELFRSPDANAPAFRFGQSDTRFLGDLYQDLDEDVKKRYALLQTPRFIESFILDRTLEPALEHFGLDETTIIDPTCGSGHFLLGAFERLFDRRLQKEPGLDLRQAALKALDAVFGADINPYAVAIARFRLTLVFLEKAGYTQLADAPQPPLHLAVADSLLHNPHLGQGEFKDLEDLSSREWAGDLFALEDEQAARDVLHRKYAAVVGNPPYITVKDRVLRDRYRSLYSTAAGKYSLAVPFTERFFQLGRQGARVGMITSNAFMKREFGKKLIQEYFPTVNLDVIVNTSGAYIPGHGTPTVLLFGSSETPRPKNIRAVLASRGEPATPDDPEKGEVWSSIAEHWNDQGFENEYISVACVGRQKLAKHPWSLAGGGAEELKALLEARAAKNLGGVADSIGITSFTLEDEVFLRPRRAWTIAGVPDRCLRPMVIGEAIRDWTIAEVPVAYFPYNDDFHPISELDESLRALWPYRTGLANNKLFGGKTKIEGGLKWYEYGRLTSDKLRTPLSIAFAFVASHNHFVLDRGGKVFKQSAPIIKLPDTATEDDHLALLAYLNSSTACFWMKQVSHQKQMVGGDGVRVADQSKVPYEFAATQLAELPIPKAYFTSDARRELVRLARMATTIVEKRAALEPLDVIRRALQDGHKLTDAWLESQTQLAELQSQLIFLQEELDYLVYWLFELTESKLIATGSAPLEINAGERAFEIRSQRNQDGFAVLSEPRPEWGKELISLWNARMAALEQSKSLQVIEDPHYKRRWIGRQGLFNQTKRRDEFRDELKNWLLFYLEKLDWRAGEPTSVRRISSTASSDERFNRVAMAREGSPSLEVVNELMQNDSLPYLAALRHTSAGVTKHRTWQAIWDLQRREDAGESVGDIPIPPQYSQKDFRRPNYWSLRGKLDVHKERFISYTGCESDEDREPVYGWAGWNHLERAQALAALYQDRKDKEGWEKDRLTPMLAGLWELIPWIKQWHNEPSEEYSGVRLGDYFESFLDGQCQALGLTREDLESWRPPETKPRRRKKGS